MKRPRKIPDWRYRPDPEYRDVKPGCVPLKIDMEGERTLTVDLRVETIVGLETLARKTRRSFAGATGKLLAMAIDEKYRKLFGF